MARPRLPYPEYLNSRHWAQVRGRAARHYRHRCCICGRGDLPLSVHHINYDHRWCESLGDVLLVCDEHHRMIEEEKRRFEEYGDLERFEPKRRSRYDVEPWRQHRTEPLQRSSVP